MQKNTYKPMFQDLLGPIRLLDCSPSRVCLSGCGLWRKSVLCLLRSFPAVIMRDPPHESVQACNCQPFTAFNRPCDHWPPPFLFKMLYQGFQILLATLSSWQTFRIHAAIHLWRDGESNTTNMFEDILTTDLVSLRNGFDTWIDLDLPHTDSYLIPADPTWHILKLTHRSLFQQSLGKMPTECKEYS